LESSNFIADELLVEASSDWLCHKRRRRPEFTNESVAYPVGVMNMPLLTEKKERKMRESKRSEHFF
jgi:hypothetical protein